jgi:pimeloyl-ACP methyl ester carboxylesterase
MPAVLVHGVPETPAVWDALRARLQRDDVIAVQLPGFGCARPNGFGATKEEYVEWLVGELEVISKEGPIDLVGHDWGAGFTIRLVSTRADLVRSWICDGGGIGNVDFEWHEFAKVWQTPGDGEKFWNDTLAQSPEERGAVYEALFGVPHEAAIELNRHIDRTMTECILALYRSATDVGKEWGPDFHDIPKPGRIVLASDDTLIAQHLSRGAAQRAGAKVAELEGLGHWWMLQDPGRSAAMLEEFWASI